MTTTRAVSIAGFLLAVASAGSFALSGIFASASAASSRVSANPPKVCAQVSHASGTIRLSVVRRRSRSSHSARDTSSSRLVISPAR